MLLVRRYINASFLYLSNHAWDAELVGGYLGLVEEIPLSVGDESGKVPDGLKYHVLDCWVEELDKVDTARECPLEVLMGSVRRVEEEGATKVVRVRAKETLADERLEDWAAKGAGEVERKMEREAGSDGDGDSEGEEWGGLGD